MTESLEGVWNQVQALDQEGWCCVAANGDQVVTYLCLVGQLRYEEKVGLYEVVLITASKSRQAPLQQAVIATILAPLLQQWTSDEFMQAIGTGAGWSRLSCRSLCRW